MSKEIYISSTPHETRLAIVEDEQLAEIYYERENEYTLAGSIYNGKVTRVLPGMQSSFVDIGLERDAFLYVTDFMEEAGDSADFETDGSSRRNSAPQQPREAGTDAAPREGVRSEGGRSEGSRSEGNRERGNRRGGRGRDRDARRDTPRPAAAPRDEDATASFDEPIAPHPTEGVDAGAGAGEGDAEGQGSRRWRGRRGRRRGRGTRDEQPVAGQEAGQETVMLDSQDESEPIDSLEASSIEIDPSSEPAAPREGGRGRNERGGRSRGDRDRGRGEGRGEGRRESAPADPEASFEPIARYGEEEYAPEPSGTPTLLPGESIRKYRDPAVVAAEDAEARRNAPHIEVLQVGAPTIDVAGWDGGSVLPGETLSRHRRNERNDRNDRNDRGRDAQRPAPPTPVFVAPVAPVFVAPVAAPEPVAAAAPVAPGEYEPAEGASASVNEGARRDLRRFEQEPEAPVAVPHETVAAPVEPAAIPQETAVVPQETAASEPDATTYDLAAETEHAAEPQFTTMQPSGEMLSVQVEDHGFAPLASQDAADPSNPVDHQGAVQSVTLAHAETTALHEEHDELEGEDDPTEIHAYGSGDLEEEEIDDEEFEYESASAGHEDGEGEEYEEETLDGSTDIAALLHDIALESDVDVAEEEADETGGFSVDDFGGEPDESAEAAPAQGEQQGRREGSRGRDGLQRDRRGGRNSGGDRGRSGGGGGGRRQSMQTTDMPAITDLLKPGQEILVQIAKEPIAKKGARITSHIALPGRFLVFMPTVNHTGVSRKISSDEERRRLKSILLSEKGDAQGGFIVRTAADGASEEELRNDLRFLIHLWNDIKMRSESSKSPALIYHDLNLIERILRDQVTDNFSAIWVDSEAEYERVLRFLQRFQPSLVRRVKLYVKETPLFEHFGVTAEIDKALKSKVWLKSGGSIVINQTEALVAIDINTGKYVGKTARLEDTILKTNLDAIPEIVRQVRLRDLGGIIVIDFIDMDERRNRAKVLQALEDAMRTDRAPSKILPFNDFGLVIMTRKRVKQSLERTLCIPDPVTEGTGMIKSPVTISNEIYVEMRKMYRHIEKTDVLLRVHPEVVKQLKANGGKRLQELEDMTKKTILVKSDPSLSPEAFDIH